MNIPFYYNSGYEDDGVEVYTCLKCGTRISVRSLYKPHFCNYCGVKYKGEKENIGNNSKYWYAVCFVEEGYWTIEKRTIEEEDIYGEEQWKEFGYYEREKPTAKQILKQKKQKEEDDKKEIKQLNEEHREYLKQTKQNRENEESPFLTCYEYRIMRKIKINRHSIMIRKDIYLEKTGKIFNERKDRLPYGTKEIINTGFKLIDKGIFFRENRK